jgi:hypothetical protein
VFRILRPVSSAFGVTFANAIFLNPFKNSMGP